MKFKIFVHPLRPKVQIEKIQKILQSLDFQVSETAPDIALVIGGDGTFSYYGRKLSIPMLFIGVPTDEILGSKSRLAEISLQHLTKALRRLVKEKYVVTKRRMLAIKYGTSPSISVLTDIYLERGLFAGCIRYSVTVTKKNINMEDNKPEIPIFTDYIIGNGVIISTSFGSSGYYSYIDRILNPQKKLIELFDDSKLGICHILPTFAARRSGHKVKYQQINSIRYTVPVNCNIDITTMREANIRLYGTSIHSEGIKIKWNNLINVTSSTKTAKIIHLV